MITPQKLASNQFDHFYKGGYRIGALRNGPGGPMRPEEWIGSITTRFGEKTMGLSTLSDGSYLRDSVIANPEQWLGAERVGETTAGASLPDAHAASCQAYFRGGECVLVGGAVALALVRVASKMNLKFMIGKI